MDVIITAPSLDPAKNVSGVSAVAQFIINNNKLCNYIHFEIGRKDNERGGIFRIKSILKNLAEWRKLLNTYPQAIIHYSFPLSAPSILRDPMFMWIALREKRQMVVHIHGGVYLTAKTIPYILNLILKWVFSQRVPFIVLSDKEARLVKEKFRVREVYSLPNCVDLTNAFSFSREYGHNPLVIGYLGRIAETKGMNYLLQACVELKKRNIPFLLKIAGAEEVKDMFLPSFRDNLKDSFEYCGLVSGQTKIDYLRSLDVFVLPSYFEGLPISLLECMSYGSIPVVTPVGSIPTIIQDGRNGIFIKDHDSLSIVTVIEELQSDSQLQKSIGSSARNTIFTDFNPQKYVVQLNKIYDTIKRP